ncbi:hypothetical protein PG984_008486 [Apiospora sp. TS-2023a]
MDNLPTPARRGRLTKEREQGASERPAGPLVDRRSRRPRAAVPKPLPDLQRVAQELLAVGPRSDALDFQVVLVRDQWWEMRVARRPRRLRYERSRAGKGVTRSTRTAPLRMMDKSKSEQVNQCNVQQNARISYAMAVIDQSTKVPAGNDEGDLLAGPEVDG